MKLLSLFKFKTKKTDIASLLKQIFNDVESNLFTEFKKNVYDWTKADSIKRYKCFVFSKFIINYSFTASYPDVDKNVVNNFNKIAEEVFSELHEEKYSSIFSYKDMKNIIDQKYDLFCALRKENKPPLCWHLIYSSLVNKAPVENIQLQILGLKKAIKFLKTKQDTDVLVGKFKDAINRNLKTIESFDLAEISFRQNIRIIKKHLTSFDIPKQLSSKK